MLQLDTYVPLSDFERQLFEVALDDSSGLLDYAAERVHLDVDSFRMRMHQ